MSPRSAETPFVWAGLFWMTCLGSWGLLRPRLASLKARQLAELLVIRDERAEDGHRPSDAVDREHLPKRHGHALLVQEPSQPGVLPAAA